MATSMTTGEFARGVLQGLVLWFVGSTLIGFALAGSWGHGGGVLLLAAWLLGAVGFLAHLVILLRSRGKPATPQNLRNANQSNRE
jgi:membrane protein DedA with SNARE-associated domain